MALIKLGFGVAGISGSIGGVVNARNRGGQYIRNRTKPTVPSSDKRAAANALLTQQVASWRSAAMDATRADWNEQAKLTTLINALGEPFHPSGMNLFLRANVSLLNTGQTEVTAPPNPALASSFAPTIEHVVDSGIEVSDIGGFDDSATGQIQIRMSAPQALSVYYFKGPWESLTSGAIATVGAVDYVLRANAALVVSQRYFFEFVTVLATGAISSRTILSAITPAALTT